MARTSTSFKKGQSGNPKGAAKKTDPGRMEVRELARKHTKPAIAKLVEIMEQTKDLRASAAAAIALLDRGWGKPPQQVIGDTDQPIVHTFKWAGQ